MKQSHFNVESLPVRSLAFPTCVIALLALALPTLTGCGQPQPTELLPLCAGMRTIDEATLALADQRERLIPLQATGYCVIAYRDINDRFREENVDVQVRFVPPDRLFIRGSKFGEIRFGTNEDEFWLRVKPEMDTYWYGSRDQAQQCGQSLMVNPANLAEAMGMIDVDTQWELFHREGWDILTLRDNGRPVKRVYVYCCDYHVQRIDYYDRSGQVSAVTELSDYTHIGDGLSVPTTIRLLTLYQGQQDASFQLDLRNIRRFEPTATQMRNLFSRPGRDGYGTMYRLEANCNFIEEQ